jgi:hypothetical protein
LDVTPQVSNPKNVFLLGDNGARMFFLMPSPKGHIGARSAAITRGIRYEMIRTVTLDGATRDPVAEGGPRRADCIYGCDGAATVIVPITVDRFRPRYRFSRLAWLASEGQHPLAATIPRHVELSEPIGRERNGR